MAGFIIELTKATDEWPKGTLLGVAKLKDAERLYPHHKVISHDDGEPYEAPVKTTPTEPKAPKQPTTGGQAETGQPTPPEAPMEPGAPQDVPAAFPPNVEPGVEPEGPGDADHG